MAGEESIDLGLVLGNLQRLAEPGLRGPERLLGFLLRSVLVAQPAPAGPRAHNQHAPDEAEDDAQPERDPQRHARRRALLDVAKHGQAVPVLAVGDREPIDQAVASHGGVGDRAPPAAQLRKPPVCEREPRLIRRPLPRDGGQLDPVVGGDRLGLAQLGVHHATAVDEVLEPALAPRVQVAAQPPVLVQQGRQQGLGELSLVEGDDGGAPLRLRGEQHRACETEHAEWDEQPDSHGERRCTPLPGYRRRRSPA